MSPNSHPRSFVWPIRRAFDGHQKNRDGEAWKEVEKTGFPQQKLTNYKADTSDGVNACAIQEYWLKRNRGYMQFAFVGGRSPSFLIDLLR